jgi:nucleoid-associated protein YgaU
MIERVSRYYDGTLAQLAYEHAGSYTITVYREFPTQTKRSYIQYTWKDGDSLGQIADRYLGGSKYWWEIMEINPEITDPFNITPATIIRVPYGN